MASGAQRRQTIAVPPSTSAVDDTANTIKLYGDTATSTDKSHFSPTLAALNGDKPSLAVISVIVCTGSNCGSTRTTSGRDNLTSDGSSHVYGVSPTLLEIEELVQELKFEMMTTTASSSTTAAAASQPCLDGTGMCTTSNAKCGLQRLHANNDWRSATSNAPTIRVTSGGCVGHCSMGPTVSVVVDSSAALDTSTGQNSSIPLPVLPTRQTSSRTWKVRYYHQVNSSSACAQVVQEVAQMASKRTSTTVDALQEWESRSPSHVDAIPSKRLSTSSFLMRRADGLRWKLLKEMSRYLARSSHTGTIPLGATSTELNPASDALNLLFDEVAKAERMAAGSDVSQRDRAQRRQDRLSLLLNRHER